MLSNSALTLLHPLRWSCDAAFQILCKLGCTQPVLNLVTHLGRRSFQANVFAAATALLFSGAIAISSHDLLKNGEKLRRCVVGGARALARVALVEFERPFASLMVGLEYIKATFRPEFKITVQTSNRTFDSETNLHYQISETRMNQYPQQPQFPQGPTLPTTGYQPQPQRCPPLPTGRLII